MEAAVWLFAFTQFFVYKIKIKKCSSWKTAPLISLLTCCFWWLVSDMFTRTGTALDLEDVCWCRWWCVVCRWSACTLECWARGLSRTKWLLLTASVADDLYCAVACSQYIMRSRKAYELKMATAVHNGLLAAFSLVVFVGQTYETWKASQVSCPLSELYIWGGFSHRSRDRSWFSNFAAGDKSSGAFVRTGQEYQLNWTVSPRKVTWSKSGVEAFGEILFPFVCFDSQGEYTHAKKKNWCIPMVS